MEENNNMTNLNNNMTNLNNNMTNLNNYVTNLGGNVSYSGVVNTQPIQSQTAQSTPQQIPNNIQTEYTTTQATVNNVIGVETPRVDYVNVYNETMGNIPNINVQPTTQQTIIPDVVQPTQTVINPTQNIAAESSIPQQMAQADVVQPTTTQGVLYTLTQTVQPDAAVKVSINTQLESVEKSKQSDEKVEAIEPIVQSGKPMCYKLRTESLLDMVNNAKKAAIHEERLPLTTGMQLVFTQDGVTIRATDNTNLFTQYDDTVKFLDSCSFCVDSELFHKLINKLDTEEVELEFVPEEHIVNVYSNGVFKLPEICDPTTSKSIEIPVDALNTSGNEEVKRVDVAAFKRIVQRGNVFAGNANIFAQLSGVYSAERVYSTDKVCMFSTDNIPELKDETFYMGPRFVNLLLQLDFTEDCTMTFRKDASGNIQYIIIKDSNKVLGGPVNPYTSDFPIQNVDTIRSMAYTNFFKVKKDLLISILDKSMLFIEKNSKVQSCNFVVDAANKQLNIKTYNNQSDQIIQIDGDSILSDHYCISVESMLKALRNCVDDEVVIYTNPDNKVCCKVTSDGIEQAISYSNDGEW